MFTFPYPENNLQNQILVTHITSTHIPYDSNQSVSAEITFCAHMVKEQVKVTIRDGSDSSEQRGFSGSPYINTVMEEEIFAPLATVATAISAQITENRVTCI